MLGHLNTVNLRLLTRLILKHMQVFSDCLWRGFLILIYCDILTKSLFSNYHDLELATLQYLFFIEKFEFLVQKFHA